MIPYFEGKINELLQGVFRHLLGRKEGIDEQSAGTISVMLGWSVYGIAKDWNKEGRKGTPEQLAERAIAALAAAGREIDGAGLLA